MNLLETLKRFIAFLKQDTWQSWIVSLILIIIIIKFVFFPILSLITKTPLPLVVVESCSMYHETNFENWWQKNNEWYNLKGIDKSEFQNFKFNNGLNKGDIVLLWGRSPYKVGDVIIFSGGTTHPIIHRVVSQNPITTKGDHNSDQLPLEKNINEKLIIGQGIARIPFIGWIKLIFFEGTRPKESRGLCR